MLNAFIEIDRNNINGALPAEILQTIFRFLSLADMKVVVTVCRLWRDVGSHSLLWSSVKLCCHKRNLEEMPQILSSTRFAMVRKITVMTKISKGLLDQVVHHPGLRTLSVGHVDLAGLNIEWVVFGLEVVQFQRAHISSGQLSALFAAIVGVPGASTNTGFQNKQQRLKSLNLSGTDVSKVDPKLLAAGIVKLKEITLTYTCLTLEQVKEMLMALSNSPTNLSLTKLNIGGNDLSGVEARLLTALTKVERVSLAGVSLSSEKASSLLVRAAERSEKNVLQRLNLSGNSLSQVPPMVLAEGAASLHQVVLYDTNLTSNQVRAILLLAAGSTKLRKLLIGSVGHQVLDDGLVQRARLNIPHIHIFQHQA